MARLLRYIHPHISRYAPVDAPWRRTHIRRHIVELFVSMTLMKKEQWKGNLGLFGFLP
jgi:hypothetical protein